MANRLREDLARRQSPGTPRRGHGAQARDEEGAARAEAPLAHEFLQHVHVALRIVLPCVLQVLR